MNNNFERGKGDWNKLFDFMDENEFTCADFLACVCSSLLRQPPEKEYKTKLMIQGIEFKISIKPDVWDYRNADKTKN